MASRKVLETSLHDGIVGHEQGVQFCELDINRFALEERLKHVALKNLGKDPKEKGISSDVRQSIKLSSEFFAAVITGGIMGYYLDKLFNISPWGLIIFLFLGFSAGVLSILQSSGLISSNIVNDQNTSREINKA